MSEFTLDLVNDPIEELYIAEHCLSQDERKNSAVLDLISLAIVARQAQGDTISCYSEGTEHALHPDITVDLDAARFIPAQRVPSEVREIA